MRTAVRTLDVREEKFPLARPFRISRGTKTAADVVTVSLSEAGRTGCGEGVPYPRYGESVASTVRAIEEMREAVERGIGREDLLRSMPAGAARNALDCAWWDLEARLSATSVYSSLGLADPPPAVATALTVGLDRPAIMGASAFRLRDAPLLKIKVDAEDIEARLRAVRSAAPDPRLIVDPNESWSMTDIVNFQSLMVELRIDLLEQPLPADADRELEGYRSAIPIAADESVHVAKDLDDLPSGYTVINIKLDKAGGLSGAHELAAEARLRGLKVMTGCMVGSSLSIAPAFAIAADSAFIDLDGPLWLAEDRVGGVACSGGMLAPPQPGFWGTGT